MALRLRLVVDQWVWSSRLYGGFFFFFFVTSARGGFGLILILILWVAMVARVGGCRGLVYFLF